MTEKSEQETPEQQLVKSIRSHLNTGKISNARLETDDRILARITDGIYRQPASALRELIANAYDADAQHVWIHTDLPRFRRISVRDDGNGFSIEALAGLIHHIGGSPKRTQDGIALGVVSKKDPTLSPKGRRLIGKIGIGLFSVAQLTRRFQIITKVAGAHHRLVAEVVLKTYTEDEVAKLTGGRGKVDTGAVRIRAEKADDPKEHGTEILLLDIRRQTRDLLQSKDQWLQRDSRDSEQPEELKFAPAYHIAHVAPANDEDIVIKPHLPWNKTDDLGIRFTKLYDAVVNEIETSAANPRLETLLDNYLRMLWTLSLSAPIDYIAKHPFDMNEDNDLDVYTISNEPKGQAKKLKLRKDQTVREVFGLTAPERGTNHPFEVYIDDVQLKRPLRFTDLPKTQHVLKRPLLLVGKAEPDLSKIPKEDRGGDLAFEAYFLWVPKIVPKEHNGILVRVADASGTLFDETFMKYQIAEITRLKQISAEVFVRKGLDAALNIDRESFNYAHPHYQYLLKWTHRAIRQITNLLKQLSSEKRAARARDEAAARSRKLQQTVRQKLEKVVPDEDIPDVVWGDNETELRKARKDGALAFDPAVVFADAPEATRNTQGQRDSRAHLEAQMAAVAQILDAYGAFEGMTYDKQQEMLRAIVAVFTGGDE